MLDLFRGGSKCDGAELAGAPLQRVRSPAHHVAAGCIGCSRTDPSREIAAFAEKHPNDGLRCVGTDIVEEIVENGAVEQRLIGHAGWNFLPIPTSFCCGSRTDFSGSAITCPIIAPCRLRLLTI